MTSETTSQPVRLQKFLAAAGLGSRRQCEELVLSGRITIDGSPITEIGTQVDPKTQVVEYDGERLFPQKTKYFMLNKPKGVLCTNNDPHGRTRVIDLFERESVRLFTVGRLDEDSEGLLIVTNDGDFAHRLAHPRFRIYRTYRVQVTGFPTSEQLHQLKEGMYFREGKFRVLSTKRVGKRGKSSFIEVVLGEGNNREIRRLFARIGHKVMGLERVAFGPIKLGKLKSGQYRELSAPEIQSLTEILDRNSQSSSRGQRSRAKNSDANRSRAKSASSNKPKSIQRKNSKRRRNPTFR